MKIDGTPYEVKASRMVWGRGKDGDNLKLLPIAIKRWKYSSRQFIRKSRCGIKKNHSWDWNFIWW